MDIPKDLFGLRLDEALRLLEDAGGIEPLPEGAGPTGLLQHIVDGLCDLSLRDGLTGIANVRHFRLALERELDRVPRTGESVSLLVVDVDYFKKVNDAWGHPAGDEVLRRVAAKLAKWIRPMDFIARTGGEEFAVILPETLAQFAVVVAERLRRKVEKMKVTLAGGTLLRVTVSIGGVVALPWQRLTADALIELADRQLYASKQAGRNRVSFETPHSTGASPEERAALLEPFARDGQGG